MMPIERDGRTAKRKKRDEQIAVEPPLPPLELPPDAKPAPVEHHLRKLRRQPRAFLGVVENGVVRPLDPDVRLPERSSVIIVAPAGS